MMTLFRIAITALMVFVPSAALFSISYRPPYEDTTLNKILAVLIVISAAVMTLSAAAGALMLIWG